MGSSRKTTQQDHQDGHASSDGEAVALLLMEAQRLVEELRACLHRSSSSTSTSPMDHLPLAAAGGAGALPPLVKGISEALSRAIMLLPQPQSTGAGRPPVMAPALPPARRGSGGWKIRRAELPQGQGGYRKELRSCMDQDDGYSWRKYGEKQIFGAKYPRSYFRCKHKYMRQCPATRQVQRSEADPSMLEFTYIGDHTCTQPHEEAAAVTMTLDELDPSSSWQHHPSPATAAAASSAHPGTVKHEAVPSHAAETLCHDHDQLVPADHDDGGAPVHCLQYLDGPSPFMTFDEHASVDSIFEGCCYTDDAYYAAAGDDELAAAVWSFGAFTYQC